MDRADRAWVKYHSYGFHRPRCSVSEDGAPLGQQQVRHAGEQMGYGTRERVRARKELVQRAERLQSAGKVDQAILEARLPGAIARAALRQVRRLVPGLGRAGLALDVSQTLAIAIRQARLLEQLRVGRERLRQLARQLVRVQEDERRRLSRALHDEAGQALTALKISLDLIQDDLIQDDLRDDSRRDDSRQDALAEERAALRERIAGAAALAEATRTQLRALAQALRPPALDLAGLNPTLEGFCRHFAAHTRMSILYQGTDVPKLPEAAPICLYRVLQEALTNVAKHACASQVRVVLSAGEQTVRLSVEDNGRGFDRCARLSAVGWPMGIGLLGMQERLEALGGRLEITSQANRGACLVASLPIEEG